MRFFIVLFILISTSLPCWPATYFVSSSGNNSATGSESDPWRTIQFAVDNLMPGDTAIVSAGTYNEDLVTRRSGAQGNRIVIRSDANTTLRGIIRINHSYITIDGFEITSNGGRIAITGGMDADYVHILNTEIHDLGGDTRYIELPRSRGVSSHPAGWIIRDNHFYGNQMAGLYVSLGGAGHLVENNEIGPGVVYEDAFRPFGDNHIIRGNYIHDMQSGGGHTDIMQIFEDNGNRVYNLLFEKNYVNGWDGQAWMFSVTSDSELITIRNNIFVDVPSSGQSYCPRTRIYNNTFVNTGYRNCQAVRLRSASGRGTANNSEIKNNIFYQSGCDDNDGWYSVDQPITGLDADYNLVFPQKRGFSESNGVNGRDPQLINPSGNDFNLQSGSPAIDAGASISTFSDDHNGDARPNGNRWDIGAFEYGASNGQTQPPPPIQPPRNLRIIQ